MKYLLFMLLILTASGTAAQKSDFIVLKKNNNRTLKTYFPGTFLKGVTLTGFSLNGMITRIANDSVYIEQQEIYQVGNQFGLPSLDTVIYTIRLHFADIEHFDYKPRRRKGFSNITIPGILIRAGFGYAVLESVNTLYRKESFSEDNKLVSIGVGLVAGGTGILWQQVKKSRDKAGGKYKVQYVKNE